MEVLPDDIWKLIVEYKQDFETCELTLCKYRKQINKVVPTANRRLNSLIYASYFINTVDPSIDTAHYLAVLVREVKYFVFCVRHHKLPPDDYIKSWEIFIEQPPMHDDSNNLAEPFGELFQYG